MKRLITYLREFYRYFKMAKLMQKEKNKGYFRYKRRLIDLVEKCSGFTFGELVETSQWRKREYANARAVHIALMVDFIGMTWHKSAMVYNKDHSNVKNCRERCQQWLETDRQFVDIYRDVFEFAISKRPILAEFYKINPKFNYERKNEEQES